MPGPTKPEDEKKPEEEEEAKSKQKQEMKPDEEEEEEDEEKKKAKALEKAGKLQSGLQSVKERLDSVLGKLKTGSLDDNVLTAVRGMAVDMGKLADAYPSPKSEKREFTSDQFDDFVAAEIKAIASETDEGIRKERGEMLHASVEEFKKAMTELEKTFSGTTPPAVQIRTYKDGWQQPDPTKTTSSATMPPSQPSVANVGKGEDGDGSGSEDSAPGEGVQDEDQSTVDPNQEEEWGGGWSDLTEGIDEELKPVTKVKDPEPQGSIGDLTSEDEAAPQGDPEQQSTAQ